MRIIGRLIMGAELITNDGGDLAVLLGRSFPPIASEAKGVVSVPDPSYAWFTHLIDAKVVPVIALLYARSWQIGCKLRHYRWTAVWPFIRTEKALAFGGELRVIIGDEFLAAHLKQVSKSYNHYPYRRRWEPAHKRHTAFPHERGERG